jgi:hypothetical protein
VALGNVRNGAIVRIIRELGGDNLITFNISVTDVALSGRGRVEMRNEGFGVGGLFSNIIKVTASHLIHCLSSDGKTYTKYLRIKPQS